MRGARAEWCDSPGKSERNMKVQKLHLCKPRHNDVQWVLGLCGMVHGENTLETVGKIGSRERERGYSERNEWGALSWTRSPLPPLFSLSLNSTLTLTPTRMSLQPQQRSTFNSHFHVVTLVPKPESGESRLSRLVETRGVGLG